MPRPDDASGSLDRAPTRTYTREMEITQVNPLSGFRLQLWFNNGQCGVVDLSAFAGRGVCAAWETPGVFEQVSVTDEGALAWPGEIDFCPDALYLRMTAQRPDEVFPSLRDRLKDA
jgi:Protein of unknown function (DUF2442)